MMVFEAVLAGAEAVLDAFAATATGATVLATATLAFETGGGVEGTDLCREAGQCESEDKLARTHLRGGFCSCGRRRRLECLYEARSGCSGSS